MKKFVLFVFLLIASSPVIVAHADTWSPPLAGKVQGIVTSEGWSDVQLLPAPVNMTTPGGWTDSLAVSDDGSVLYFSYSKNDFYRFYSSNGKDFIPTGAARTPDNNNIPFQIFSARIVGDKWTVAREPINDRQDEYTAAPGLNSAGDTMIFSKFQISPYRVTMYAKIFDGKKWGAAMALPPPINSSAGCEDDNGVIVGSMKGPKAGGVLFFESKRKDLVGTRCGGKPRLYFSVFDPSLRFQPPQLVKGLTAADTDEDTQPFVTKDMGSIYWTSVRPSIGKYAIFTADRRGDGYQAVRPIIAINNFAPPFAGKVVILGEPNVANTSQGKVMYFICGVATGDDKKGQPAGTQTKICFSKKKK